MHLEIQHQPTSQILNKLRPASSWESESMQKPHLRGADNALRWRQARLPLLPLTRVLEAEEENRLRSWKRLRVVPGMAAHTSHLSTCKLKQGDCCKFAIYFQASLGSTERPCFKQTKISKVLTCVLTLTRRTQKLKLTVSLQHQNQDNFTKGPRFVHKKL